MTDAAVVLDNTEPAPVISIELEDEGKTTFQIHVSISTFVESIGRGRDVLHVPKENIEGLPSEEKVLTIKALTTIEATQRLFKDDKTCRVCCSIGGTWISGTARLLEPSL